MSKKKILLKKTPTQTHTPVTPTPAIDLSKVKKTPNRNIEVSKLDSKKGSLSPPDMKPSARYLKSVSFRTGNAAEPEPYLQQASAIVQISPTRKTSAIPKSKNSDFESNIRLLDGSTERERSILKKRERVDTDDKKSFKYLQKEMITGQDEDDSLNSGRNSHQFDIYFTNPSRQISHSLPPSMQRPDLTQFRNYRNLEDVVHEDPRQIISKNKSPMKQAKKSPPKKISPLQKALNEEIKMIEELKQQLKLSEVCKQKNSSSLNRYKEQLSQTMEHKSKLNASTSAKQLKQILSNSLESRIKKGNHIKLDVAPSFKTFGENEQKDLPIGVAFKKALVSAQRSPMVVKPGTNMQDELYCNRMLPQIPHMNITQYEEQTISTFYSQSMRQNQEESQALKELQLLHKGLSCFTKYQNENHGTLVSNIAQKNKNRLENHDDLDLADSTSAEKLREVQQQIKSTVQRVSKVVCNRDLLHIEIPLQSIQSKSQSSQKMSKTIELCQNSKFSLKVGVKGKIPPLKLKLEYMNQLSGKLLSHQELVSIKGCINFYYSHKNPDPKSNQPHEHSCEGCDGKIEKQLAPKLLKINQFENVSGKYIANASQLPFNCDFIFITLDCLEGSLLDNIRLEIQAQTQMPIIKKALKNDSDEEQETNIRQGNTQKLGLHKFMKQTTERIEDMVEDSSQWDQYQKQVLSKIQKYINAKRSSPLRADVIDEQFLDSIEVPFEPHQSKHHIEQISKNRQRVLLQLLELGDYVGHNKLNATFGQHDLESRQQKHIQFNNEYAKKQEIVVKSKNDQEISKHKMKVFLNHRKQILSQIRDQMAAEKYALALMRKKVMIWIKMIKLRQVYQDKLFVNFQESLEAENLRKKRKVCITVIIKAYKKLKAKKNAFVGERKGGPESIRYPRYQMTFSSLMLNDKYQHLAQGAFKSFLQDTADIYHIVNKVSTHGMTVSILQKQYKRARMMDQNRIEAMLSLFELVKRNQITQFISNQGSNQKSKQKQLMTQQLAKIRGLKSETMREICEKIFNFRKLKHQIQDRLGLKSLMENRFFELQRRLDIQNHHHGCDGCDEFYHDNDFFWQADRFGKLTQDWPWDKDQLIKLISHADKYIQKASQKIENLTQEAEKLQAFFGDSLKKKHFETQDHQHHHHKPTSQKKQKGQGKKQTKQEQKPDVTTVIKQHIRTLTLEERIGNLGICVHSSQDLSQLNKRQLKWSVCYQDMEKLILLGIQLQEKYAKSLSKQKEETMMSTNKSDDKSQFLTTQSNHNN